MIKKLENCFSQILFRNVTLHLISLVYSGNRLTSAALNEAALAIDALSLWAVECNASFVCAVVVVVPLLASSRNKRARESYF